MYYDGCKFLFRLHSPFLLLSPLRNDSWNAERLRLLLIPWPMWPMNPTLILKSGMLLGMWNCGTSLSIMIFYRDKKVHGWCRYCWLQLDWTTARELAFTTSFYRQTDDKVFFNKAIKKEINIKGLNFEDAKSKWTSHGTKWFLMLPKGNGQMLRPSAFWALILNAPVVKVFVFNVLNRGWHVRFI